MRVENKGDRATNPGECDACGMEDQGGSTAVARFERYGPGHQVAWHCFFCRNFHDPENITHKNLARLGHFIMAEIKAEAKKIRTMNS